MNELSWLLDSAFLTANLIRGAEVPAQLDVTTLSHVTGWLGQIAEYGHRMHRAALLGLASCVLAEFAVSESDRQASPARDRIRAVTAAMSNDIAKTWTVAELASLVSNRLVDCVEVLGADARHPDDHAYMVFVRSTTSGAVSAHIAAPIKRFRSASIRLPSPSPHHREAVHAVEVVVRWIQRHLVDRGGQP
jgi:hypothetical protein